MNPTEEFRIAIHRLLSEVQRLLRVKPVSYPFEYDEDWENEVVTSIWNQVVLTGLFSKTPARPEEVGIIAEQVCKLPLVKDIPLDPPPYNPRADHVTYARDLEVLEHKLREMLEYLDRQQPSETNASKNHDDRTSAENHARAATRRARPRRSRIRKNMKPSERRAQTVATIKKELDTLRPQMTGSESDYEVLRKKYNRFLTFRALKKNPVLKEAVMDVQARRQHIWLAEKLTAAFHGMKDSTIHTDWAHHKPDEYRKRNK